MLKKVFVVSSLLFVSAIFTLSVAWADRGHFVLQSLTLEPNVTIRDEGQKAIIAWDGEEEIMVLSTDLSASEDSVVLEFMPLPSKPTEVKLRDIKPFEAVEKIINAHRPKVANVEPPSKGVSPPLAILGRDSGVQIVFHQKVGPHDVTIAMTNNTEGFIKWVKKFLAKQKVRYEPSMMNNLKPVVNAYLKDNIKYFVFDIVKLSPEKKSCEPILYRFNSKDLYYPLRVSTLSEGVTQIDLFLITTEKTDIWGTKTGFAAGFYISDSSVYYQNPIKFKITKEEMVSIDPLLLSLHMNIKRPERLKKPPADPFIPMVGREGRREYVEYAAWFTACHFTGNVKSLTKDFIIKKK
ncbi:MAG: DUF2330 domain-containing protein [bacterium]